MYVCFLLLNSCSTNHDIETAIKKHINETKNANINEIKNLIEISKIPLNKNEMPIIEPESQKTVDIQAKVMKKLLQ
ncbi:hypothetical protein [Borreliella afzelii]|uniref:Ferritin-like metal-binding protein YciE n=1 Tax=Borreliella afzelii TaxID=29518 RepID=A0AB34Z3B3_BORAF|nr:ferritin-like metal-binding protein YciE [Borreliella afzelii]